MSQIMYEVRPFNARIKIESYKQVMYKCKSLYEEVSFLKEVKSNADPQAIEDLFELQKQQLSHVRRLNRIQDKLNQLCDDLNLTYLLPQQSESKITQKKTCTIIQQENKFSVQRVTSKINKNSSVVNDLVIQVSAFAVPYSIIVAFTRLASKYKSFIQFFIHGSSLVEFERQKVKGESLKEEINIKNLQALFQNLNLYLNDSRNSYDYGVTLIWKRLENNNLGPVLNLNSTTKIYGEANIARYLNRLAESSEVLNQIDSDWIDMCTNEILTGPKYENYLLRLNKYLETAKYLSSSLQPSLCDIYNWSMIKQVSNQVETKNLNSLNNWIKRIEEAYIIVKLINKI